MEYVSIIVAVIGLLNKLVNKDLLEKLCDTLDVDPDEVKKAMQEHPEIDGSCADGAAEEIAKHLPEKQ